MMSKIWKMNSKKQMKRDVKKTRSPLYWKRNITKVQRPQGNEITSLKNKIIK